MLRQSLCKKMQAVVWRFRDFCVLLHSTNRRFVHYNVTTLRMANMNEVNFDILVNRIEETQHVLQNNARLVINRHVTAKAWLVGCYIVEYEQKGEDRAKYGDKLIKCLSQRLGGKKLQHYGIKNLSSILSCISTNIRRSPGVYTLCCQNWSISD